MKSWLVLSLALVFQLNGQSPSTGGFGWNAAFLKLFQVHPHFSVEMLTVVYDAEGREQVQLPMVMSLLEGRVRMEADLGRLKGAKVIPGGAELLKNMGMDLMVTLVDLEKKNTRVLYPRLKAYAEMPLPPEEIAAARGTIEKTILGTETVRDKVIEKSRVIFKPESGEPLEVTLWSGERGFPIQLQFQQEGMRTVLRFKDPKLEKPDAALFAVPDGFTRYEDSITLLQEEARKQVPARR
jgi:hypothetical protein